MAKTKPKYRLLRAILLTLNLFVAGGLLFAILAGTINPSFTAVFSVFGLLYPPLLLANVIFIVIWFFLARWRMLLSLAIILLGYGTLFNNLQFNNPDKPEEGIATLKILSYNIQRFGLDVSEEQIDKNKSHILGFLKDEDADFVCLQEYHGKGKTLYEPLAEMKSGLNSASYYYESYFNPRFEQITGLVIFSKHNAINKGKLKFDGSRTFGIYTDIVASKDTIRVYNIHLASIQLSPSDIDFVVGAGQEEQRFTTKASEIYGKLSDALVLREQQVSFLLNEIERCPYPVLLAGDFNDTPSSFVYGMLTDRLNDAFKTAGSGFSITYAGQIPFLRIDYLLHDSNFQTVNYSRQKLDYSDHYPISALMHFERLPD